MYLHTYTGAAYMALPRTFGEPLVVTWLNTIQGLKADFRHWSYPCAFYPADHLQAK